MFMRETIRPSEPVFVDVYDGKNNQTEGTAEPVNKKQSDKPSGTKKTKSNKSKLGAQTEQNKKMIRNPKEPEGKKTKEKHKCKQF